MNAPDLNVITVINPSENTEVDIRPQEILQIVLTDAKSPSWGIEHQMSKIHMKVLRHETFYCDGFERNREGNFQVLPHAKKFGSLQNHFWFRVNPADCKKVQELEIKYLPIAVIIFREDSEVVGKLKVNLIVEKEDKDDFFNLMEQTVFTGKDPIAHEAQIAGLMDKQIDEDNGYILNPGWIEQVVLECRQRIVMIELVEPSHSKQKWNVTATTDYFAGEVNYSLTELTSRFINGIRVQRFILKNHLHNMPVGVVKMRLGDVKFSLSDANPKWDKKINFFVTQTRETNNFFGGEKDEDEEIVSFLRNMEYNYKPRKPRKMPVTIEEIDIKGDIKAGAKLIKVFIPKVKKLEFVDPQNNSMITIPDNDQELVIQLYTDTACFPPHYAPSEWRVELAGNCMKTLYVVRDNHRQRFHFQLLPNVTKYFETLTFKMRDKIKKIHVSCKKIVQEINSSESDTEKVLNELLNHPTYDWRTIDSLNFETGVPQDVIEEILDIQHRKGIVRKHANDEKLWGHCDRTNVRILADCRE